MFRRAACGLSSAAWAKSSNVPEEIDPLVNFAENWDGLADAFELESTRNKPYGIVAGSPG